MSAPTRRSRATAGRTGGEPVGREAVGATLEAAAQSHQQGELDQAERLYRIALSREPGHATALHGLGLVRAHRGHLDDGVRLIRRALRRHDASAAMHNDLGAVLKLLGRLDAAAAAFEAALAVTPGFAQAHYNLGATLYALGRAAPALDHFRQALASDPDLAAAHADLGVALTGLGRPADALSHCERAVALSPGNAKARTNLGKVLHALDRHADALACFEVALALEPDSSELQVWNGLMLMQLGRLEAACDAFRRALVERPDFAALHCNLGVALIALHLLDEAVGCLERAIALQPDLAEAHNDLGNALQGLGRPADAAVSYRAALALRPNYVDAHNNLGVALAALERYDEAMACYRAALAIDPGSAEAHNNLGTALAALGREDEALGWYDKTLALAPMHAGALANTGSALKALGRLDAARAAIEAAIALEPRTPRFYQSLVECRRIRAGEPLLVTMEALAGELETLPPSERIYLHFALAKAYEDCDEPERSFRHLCAGNALKRPSVDYDEAVILAGFDRLRAVFTPALMRDHAGRGDPTTTPVFIVGMPRSGTTLVEQILASHPRVFGAGELECFPAAVRGLIDRERAAGTFPELLRAIDPEALRALATAYRCDTERLAPAASRITDKLPLNFVHVGLIHLALPNARIVHVRRDPLDTCLSCFSKLFAGNQPYAYELGELGRYYRNYDVLMAHWRELLPAGVMLELQYEDLVADLEGQARGLVAHCGLDWDDTCLAFHAAARPVRTASLVQVRQPLYRHALGRAGRYRALLGPLLEALAPPPESADRPSGVPSTAG